MARRCREKISENLNYLCPRLLSELMVLGLGSHPLRVDLYCSALLELLLQRRNLATSRQRTDRTRLGQENALKTQCSSALQHFVIVMVAILAMDRFMTRTRSDRTDMRPIDHICKQINTPRRAPGDVLHDMYHHRRERSPCHV
jgi:hypothetical protein